MRIVNWTIDLTLRLAARHAPSALTDRLVEEWRAELAAIPGMANKLAFMAGLLFKGDGALPGRGSRATLRLVRLLIPATLCAAIAFGGSFLVPHSFVAEASMTAAPPLAPSRDEIVRRIWTTPIDEGVTGIRRTILRPELLQRLIAVEFNLYPTLRRSRSMPDVVKAMQRAIEIRVSGDGDESSPLRIAIRFRYEDASTARQVAERLMTCLLVASSEDRFRHSEGITQFMEAQLQDARRRLEEMEATDRARDRFDLGRSERGVVRDQERLLAIKLQLVTAAAPENRRSLQVRFKVTGSPVVERVPGRRWFVVAGAALGLCLGAVMILSDGGKASGDPPRLPEA